MSDSKKVSGRKLAVIAALCLSAGLLGSLVGRIFASALQTSPAWVGPAILIASIAVLMVGVLLVPTAIRVIRAEKNGPAA